MFRFKFWESTLGMSLIEVTIALVVLGIVGISLFGLFVKGSTSTAVARREVTAVNLAQGKLEEIKALPYDAVKPIPPEDSTDKDSTENRVPFASVSGYTYRVHVEVSEHNTKTVTVAVYYYQEGDQEREVTLTTDVAKR